MNPVDWARELLPGNGDLRPQKDRKMGFCVFNQVRRRGLRIVRGDISLFGENVTARPLRCGSFPQKVTLHSPVRLQARSQRRSVATNLLRGAAGRFFVSLVGAMRTQFVYAALAASPASLPMSLK